MVQRFKHFLSILLLLSGQMVFAAGGTISPCEDMAEYYIDGSSDFGMDSKETFNSFLEMYQIKHKISVTDNNVSQWRTVFVDLFDKYKFNRVKDTVFKTECEKAFMNKGSKAPSKFNFQGLYTTSSKEDDVKKDANTFSNKTMNVANKNDNREVTTVLQPTCRGTIEVCAPFLVNTFHLPQGFKQLMAFEDGKSTPGVHAYDEKDCECLDKKREIDNKNATDVGLHAADETKKLKELVTRAGYRKFINEYAALREDLNYYASAETWIYEGKKDPIEAGLCQNSAGFRKEVEDLCRKNGTLDGSQERMKNVLGSINPEFSSGSFEDGLKALDQDIRVLRLPASMQRPGGPTTYKRDDYDRSRLKIAEKGDKVVSANMLLTELMVIPSIKKNILKKTGSDKTPLYGILQTLISPELRPQIETILQKLNEQFEGKNSSILSLLRTVQSEKNSDDKSNFENEINTIYNEAINVSPSFKNLIINKKLFDKTAGQFVYDKNHIEGMLGVMEADSRNLKNNYRDRCETVQKNFAKAVCTEPNEMLKNVRPKDLALLVKYEHKFLGKNFPELNQDGLDKALCDINDIKSDKEPFFAEVMLSSVHPHKKSDYTDRMLFADKQKNSFYLTAKAVMDDPELFKKLTNVTQSGGGRITSLDSYKPKAESSSDQLVFSKPQSHFAAKPAPHASLATVADPAQAAAPADITAARDVAGHHKADEGHKTMTSPVFAQPSGPAYAAQPIASAVSENSKFHEEKITDFRDRLSKDLSGMDKKDKVSEHINSISEKDAQEMLRLRDQIQKDSETIAQLRLEQEKIKTESARVEYEALKAKYDSLDKEIKTATPSKIAQSTSTGGSTTGHESNQMAFESGTLKAPVAMNGSTGGRSSGGFGGTSSMSQGSITDSGSGTSNATGSSPSSSSSSSSTVNVSSSGSTDTRGLALTVTQSVSTDGKAPVVEDPNRVLINYLTKNEPSVKQLEELKMAGLILTEEDISKDGKKVQVKKTIKFNELSAEAKIFVEKKLAQVQMTEAKRNYSRQLLMYNLLGTVGKKTNLNVQKTGSLSF